VENDLETKNDFDRDNPIRDVKNGLISLSFALLNIPALKMNAPRTCAFAWRDSVLQIPFLNHSRDPVGLAQVFPRGERDLS
jgi:hypothetical protein